jgi:hypothetical protein
MQQNSLVCLPYTSFQLTEITGWKLAEQRLTFGKTNHFSEACMTRVVVFLATTLLAASLGAVGQNNSNTTAQNPALTAQAGAGPQSASAPNTAPPSAGANDSNRQATTTQPGSNVKDSAPGQEMAGDPTQLPQTSTILPLLGLIGLGSLIAGFFARR